MYVLESSGNMKVILASNSPRRRALLSLLDLEFNVVPAEINESHHFGESPLDYVLRLASEKAIFVKAKGSNKSQDEIYIVVAADTTVVDGNQILGKPANDREADQMLRQLRGRVHQVYTGIAVSVNDALVTDLCCTDVPMRNYSDEELKAYIKTGDPLDKAGAYAIQNTGFHPVGKIQGCFSNVVGLPLCHLVRVLRFQGVLIEPNTPLICQEQFNYSCLISAEILSKKL